MNAGKKTAEKEPGERLTPCEAEVAHWMAEGKTLWETGKILGRSESTIRKHRDGIYRKMDVRNRVEFLRSWIGE